MAKKTAVVLFNLGGPDNIDNVRPFLFNLFYDKAIISLPNPFRYFIARLISCRRNRVAQEIYRKIGGKSPILEETEKQAGALQNLLNSSGDGEYKIFVSMRYWHPFSYEAAGEVKQYNPDELVLLPLYPQFSTTTTESSFNDWSKVADKYGLNIPARRIENYHLDKKFIEAHVEKIGNFYKGIDYQGKIRILFSAHGLPKKVIEGGDPYQRQVEETVEAIVDGLAIDELDYIVCYQSRVGPLEWIGPSTDNEIERAGADGVAVIVIPIAFVSEHSETLVELDIEYRHLAEESGVPAYYRVPALGDDGKFIESLAGLVGGK